MTRDRLYPMPVPERMKLVWQLSTCTRARTCARTRVPGTLSGYAILVLRHGYRVAIQVLVAATRVYTYVHSSGAKVHVLYRYIAMDCNIGNGIPTMATPVIQYCNIFAFCCFCSLVELCVVACCMAIFLFCHSHNGFMTMQAQSRFAIIRV